MSEEEEQGLSVFVKDRKFTRKLLNDAEIYYAKGRKLQHLLNKKDQFIEQTNKLEEKQLLNRVPNQMHHINVERYEDYFKADRIMITLRNDRNEIIGFAGRSIVEQDKPKYLFTKRLDKKHLLYRLNHVKRKYSKDRKLQALYIVEGIFDALRLEKNNQAAVAVLGSHLTQTQTSLIEEYVKSLDCAVTLCVFMDSDEAGLKGNYETIRNLWKRSALRKCNINVNVITSGEKDPDEYYSKCRKEENEGIATYSVFEYLFRYHLRNEETTLAEVDIQEEYSSKTIEEKINILHKIESFLLDDEWREIIGRYHSLYAEGKQDVNVPEDFSFGLIKGYVQGENAEKYCGEEKRDYLYHMRNALQIARTSYEREDIRLDEWTWDRIEICADAFFVHFYEDLLANELSPRTIQIPMIEAMTPKKLDVQRRKLIYCHEELVLQQYVLNELLSRGCYSQYEEFIPAIRYQSGRGTYMTGYGYQDIDEVVSFAYQIDMSAINGDSKIENGMYRPFYDCWKDYIQYVQDGIQRLNGNAVYRVKLDIKGFYDNIKRHIVRNALYKPFQQALRKDDSKFACFRGKDNDPDGDSCARNLLEWILSELFKTEYYSAADGKLYKKSDENCAIPQGPNLSAYIANVVLFEVDKKVYEIVKEVNAKCEEDKIVVRYCRYVDDMIIISSNPSILLCIKDVIHSTLYQLGLELSPKTDSEEGISKEEALEWTVDERGGLGVSAAFDMADDSLDSVLDECDEYDVTDRREALRLLRSTLSPMIYEGLKTEIDFMKLLEIVFKTGEIRINDIIRFSELMLYHAAENMSDIWENYVGLWKQGMQYCPSDSILRIEGMSTYVFLEGCCRILKQQNQAKQAESYSLWKKSEIKIRDTLKGVDIWQKIEEEIHEKELLKKNAWVLNLKLIELYILLGNEQTISLDVESNEYLERWLWYMKKSQKMKLAKPKHKELQRREKEENILRDFHYVVSSYLKAKESADIEEINSQMQTFEESYRKNARIVGKNVLIDCIRIWCIPMTKTEKNVDIAFRVLVNLLRPEIKAETVGNIGVFNDYLFDAKKETLLPVYPGVHYPGIMAVKENSSKSKIIASRIDFMIQEEAKNVLDETRWIESTDKILEIEQEQKALKRFEFPAGADPEKYISLDKYCNNENNSPRTVLEYLVELYSLLKDTILGQQKKLSNQKLVLSKNNVFIVKNNGAVSKIELGISYLIPSEVSNDVVAQEKEEGSYILKTVNERGSAFWIAGHLLGDACHSQNIILAQREMEEQEQRDASMLDFSLKRLQGHYLHKGCGNRSEHSYRESVERTIKNIEGYLENKEKEELYLANAIAVNSFIRLRMTGDEYNFSDCSLQVAIWAKTHLRYEYKDIMSCIEKEDNLKNTPFDLERRVSKWYCYLAKNIHEIYEKEKKFIGLQTLAAGIYADGILMNLRMQVLERLRSLDDIERDKFLKSSFNPPLNEFGLENDEILTIAGDWSLIWKNLIQLKHDRNIRFITHIGWVVMLAKFYEIHTVETENKKSEVENNLKKIINILKPLSSEETDPEKFPFDSLSMFYNIWCEKNILQLITYLNELDKKSEIEVKTQSASDYRQSINAGKITVTWGTQSFKETPYFLTFSKLGHDIGNVEHNISDENQLCFSTTVIDGKVVGVSSIVDIFGKKLQLWEKGFDKDSVQKELKADVNSMMSEGNLEEESTQGNKNDSTILAEAEENDKSSYSKEERERIESGIQRIQRKSWEKRKKGSKDADRIAIFQFDINTSYLPPDREKCPIPGEKNETDKENEPETSQTENKNWSCKEFRRRKLLEKVFDACSCLGVDILLLPEYSVRPETVEWMWDEIINKNYEFSVWAGTFKIPKDYHFNTNYWKDDLNNNSLYWQSALLPVILNVDGKDEDKKRNVKILAERYKKYPSIALHEDINTIPAFKGMFKPLMKRGFISGNMEGALNDVTEVICAEMFALSSPGNYQSFLKESFNAYNNYTENSFFSKGQGETGKKEKKYEDYAVSLIKDLKEFGSYISAYQEEGRANRTPIVLIPACTTRAVDYYVIGQGNYLAAGVKTVLCNSCKTTAGGGSCFIGPDSWDDRKLNKGEELLKENTIYHGLKPGIYMQTSKERCRGALGEKEQALLVCDISPYHEKNSPNIESMVDAFSIVAHIPILEEKIYVKQCIGKNKCSKKDGFVIQKEGQEREEMKNLMANIIEHCQDRGSTTTMTESDEDAEKMEEYLKRLGLHYNSDWLYKRGEYYKEFHKTKPQRGIAPTLIDWMYIEIDYQKFMEDKKQYLV